jgi:hypothetical protein
MYPLSLLGAGFLGVFAMILALGFAVRFGHEGITSLATLMLAVGTLGLVVITYEEMIDSHSNADHQLRAFQNEARIRLRSYLSITASRTPLELGKQVTASVLIQASGQTPALDVQADEYNEVRAYPWPKGQPLIPTKPAEGEASRVSLSPGNAVNIVSRLEIVQPLFDAITKQKTVRFWMWGKINYHDVFGCHRSQTFCFTVNDTNGSNPPEINICAEHNDPEGDPGACPGK